MLDYIYHMALKLLFSRFGVKTLVLALHVYMYHYHIKNYFLHIKYTT